MLIEAVRFRVGELGAAENLARRRDGERGADTAGELSLTGWQAVADKGTPLAAAAFAEPASEDDNTAFLASDHAG